MVVGEKHQQRQETPTTENGKSNPAKKNS